MQIKTSDRVTLVGQTGSGKSFFARRLCAPIPRLLILDEKGELDDWGAQDWGPRSARKLFSDEPFRLRWVPGPGETYRYEEFFQLAYEAGNLTVYIDELTAAVPHGTRPGPYLASLYQRGRSLGVGTIACTQRPAWVPMFTLSEAQWLVMFRLRLEVDRKRMAEQMGPEVLIPIRDPHGFYISHQSWSSPRYYPSIKK